MKARSFIISSSIAALLVLGWIGLKLTFSSDFYAREHGARAIDESAPDWLIVGPSHADTGFSVPYFRSQGIEAFVVSYPEMNPIEFALLVKHVLLPKFSAPKLIFVDLFARHFMEPPRLRFLELFYALPLAGKTELMQIMWDSYVDARTPHFWYQLVVRGHNDDFLQRLWAPAMMDAAYDNGMKRTFRAGLDPRAFENLRSRRARYELGAELDPTITQGLKNLLALLAPFKEKIVVLETPFASPVADVPDLQSVSSKIEELVRSQGFTYLRTADGFDRTQEWTLYYDEHHFSEAGRTRHSEHFLRWIRR